MKNLLRPSFITFFIGVILMFIGLGSKSSGHQVGNYIMYFGILLIGIFWIWSIAAVISATDLKPFQKRFWMIVVIAVPVLGGLVFHILHQQPGKITT